PASFDEMSEVQIKQHISSIDEQIGSQPKSGKLYLQKGTLLTKWAQQKSRPSKRTSLYYQADKALSQAERLSQSKGGIATRNGIDQVLKMRWSRTHHRGAQLSHDTATEGGRRWAAIAFEKATAIMPYSSPTYPMARPALYGVGGFPQAIGELERSQAKISGIP